jgi:hypothetical protein
MSKFGDFVAVRKDIAKLMHQPEYDDGSAGPVLVRLAWYVTNTSAPLIQLNFHAPLHLLINIQAFCRYL